MRQQIGATAGILSGWVVLVSTVMPSMGVAQTTTRVSVSTQGEAPFDASSQAAISADGRYVAFQSIARNLVAGDGNGTIDIFVHDRQTGQTTRVSLNTQGGDPNGISYRPALSNDGRFVSFLSAASNLIAGDTNNASDIFVHDRQTGQTTRVSVAADGQQGNGDGDYTAISGDGRYVAFNSRASNLVPGDGNGKFDIFVHDRQTGQTTRVSVNTQGGDPNDHSTRPALSADGRFVAFESRASNLVPDDTNFREDIFVHDRQTGQTTRVSVATGGAEGTGLGINSRSPALSADGRYVAFASGFSNLVSGDGNGHNDVFVHDRQTGQTTRVSVNSQGGDPNGESNKAAVSANGRYVAFNSSASNLVAGDGNGEHDVFVHDRQTGQTTRVSVNTQGGDPNGKSINVALSADGRYVAFESGANNLVPGDQNGKSDIFLVDRQGGSAAAACCSDLNGDGKADLVWRNTKSGVVAIWLMNGAAIASTGFPGGVPLNWQITAIGDVNGDGRADVIWRHAITGAVAVWLMNGTTVTATGFPGGAPVAWALAGTGDLNGDGQSDLVWRNTNSGAVAVWLMNGTTILSSGFLGGIPTAWEIAGIGDVNADGKADVLWRNRTDGLVAVWVMNGLTITSVGFPGSAPTEWAIAELGDVDGNGTADLIWRNTTSGAVAVWLMNGTMRAASGSFAGKALEWAIAQVGDVDGDGKADVIWRNTSTGVVEVWLMNSLTITSTGSPGATSTEWEIQ